LDFVFFDEVKKAASVCKKLGILRFSFTGFFKSILNKIYLHPVSILPFHMEFLWSGGKLESSAFYGREYQDF